MDRIIIENQFQEYLKRMELHESLMHPTQLTELRRAFFGGTGQLLVQLAENVSKMPPKQSIKVLDDMLNQVHKFWDDEKEKVNRAM
jgi:hypothetical protein